MAVPASRSMVARARGGDERAFASLCLRSLPDVYDIAARLVGPGPARILSLEVFGQLFGALSTIDDDAHFHWLALGSARRLALARPGEGLPTQGSGALASLQFMERDQVAIFDLIVRRKLGPAALAVALGVSETSAAVVSRRTPAAVAEQAAAWAAVHDPSWPCREPARMAGGASASPRRAARLAAAHVRECAQCRAASTALDVAAAYAALPVAETPAALLTDVANLVSTRWPDRVRESSFTRRTIAASGSRPPPWRVAVLGATAAIAVGFAAVLAAVVMQGAGDDTFPGLLDPESPVPMESPFAPSPTRPRPTATSAALGTETPLPMVTPSPGAVAPSETPPPPSPTIVLTPSATASATPTNTVTPTPAASPTAEPPTPVPTPTAVVCLPRIAANVAALALIPGQDSFFYALNQALCDRITFAATSNVPWLSARADSDVIETGALVPVHLAVNIPSLPGTGEGNFASAVSLNGGPAGTATVQVSVLRIGGPPSLGSPSGICSGGFVTFSVFVEDDYGVTSVTLRSTTGSGAVSNVPLFMSSGIPTAGTWTASLTFPADVQGWAITATDGASQSRSTVVTPTGCS